MEINFFDLLYTNIDKFWQSHAFAQQRKEDFWSKEFRDLFEKMVAYDPEDRITIEDALRSEWC